MKLKDEFNELLHIDEMYLISLIDSQTNKY